MVQTRAQVHAQVQTQAHLDNHDGDSPLRCQKDNRKRPRPREPKRVPKRVPERVEPSSDNEGVTHLIAYWVKKRYWPLGYTLPTPKMVVRRTIARRIPRTLSGTSPTNTQKSPSYKQSRTQKCIPYSTPSYEMLLKGFGSILDDSQLGVAPQSHILCKDLLDAEQPVPRDGLFSNIAIFHKVCKIVRRRNEARILRDFTPLIVPSAETAALSGEHELDCLVEALDEGWNSSLPLINPRPQPDYCVGFRDDAFISEQLTPLKALCCDRAAGNQYLFMATNEMFFPFLTCEVKCGAVGLDTADRQNAHSMTLAVRGVVDLFQRVNREKGLHRQIVAFSISHDNSQVRLYGHYAEIDGQTIRYYRHTIRELTFTDEKNRWVSYRFTKATYTNWMPQHLRKICSAIDMLPLINESALDTPPTTTAAQSSESGGNSMPDATPESPSEGFAPTSKGTSKSPSEELVPSSEGASSSEESAARNRKRKRRKNRK